MQGSLLTFQKGLAQLRSYLSATEQVIEFGRASVAPSWPAEAADLVKMIRTSGLPVFQTSFNGALLRLAADFEQVVNGIASGFLAALPSRIAHYESLPEKLRSSNERLTGQALARRGRHAGLDKPKLIMNLHSCMQGTQPYVINADAILATEHNLTPGELADFMQRFGIQEFWEKMSLNAGLQAWAGTPDGARTQPRIQTKLHEFIMDRNTVAHPTSGPSSVGPSVVIGYIEYFEALGPALLSLFEQHLAGMSSRSTAP